MYETVTCSICGADWMYSYNYLKKCGFCGAQNVGFCCSLAVDKSGGLTRRCFKCAVPLCQDCGWEGTGMVGRGTQYAIKKVVGGKTTLICPNCESDRILAHPTLSNPFPEAGDDNDDSGVGSSSKSEEEVPPVFKNVIDTLDLEDI